MTLKNLQSIIVFHEGSHTELQYDLMTSGIPIDAIPVTANGRLKTNNHTQWIARRRAKEASEEFLYGQGTFNKIDIPSHRDILVGKGKPFQQHPGNVYLRFLVGQKMYEYANACKRVKPYITWELVERIQATSGCFPGKGDDDWWVEATDQEARRKVAKAFIAALVVEKQRNLVNDFKDCRKCREILQKGKTRSRCIDERPVF